MGNLSSKQRIFQAVDKRKNEIIELGDAVYRCPETGFREFAASGLIADKFRQMGLHFIQPENIPGLKVTLDTGREGPGIAILGELDAIVCSEHPDANPQTGAVHACGHNVQVASMVGAAMGILDSGILGELCGKIHFIAVPAEEYIEVDFRKELKGRGIISYLGGKPEFLRRGFFDDVDICCMIHVWPGISKLAVDTSFNGCMVKKAKFIGKAAHAGQAPHEGINALYAANLSLSAINSIRETFREEDFIRVHPIMTKGGGVVNVIPDDVRIEMFVRSRTIEGILSTSKKVDRALVGGAVAMGAAVEIEDIPGYMPYNVDKNLVTLAKSNIRELYGSDAEDLGHTTGSSDLGDLSSLMPVIQLYAPGVSGGLHSREFKLNDPESSYIMSSKLLAAMALDLLRDNAGAAGEVIKKYTPVFTSKEEYFAFTDKIFSNRLFSAQDILK